LKNQSATRRLIIDTDTASDDAVAILMALSYPDVEIDAITVVSGNVPLAQASINARYTLQLCGAEVPVYEGCAQPLTRDCAHAEWFHGPDGMGDMNYPAPTTPARPESATDELVRRFAKDPGLVDLVTLGPLTNIATALRKEPRMAQWIRHCYVMGGAACTVGNVTPAAEYNIWCDPEAAAVVFESGMNLTMIGWELSRFPATLDAAEMQQIRNIGTEKAQFAIDCNTHALRAVMEIQGETGLALADPVAMAVALDDTICTRASNHHVAISCDESLTRGMTVVDELNVTGNPANATICWTLDAERWKALLEQSLV